MYASQAAATGAVVTVLVTLIGLLALFFIVRAAVTEGMKSYQKWREATGRDIPPADVATPPAQP